MGLGIGDWELGLRIGKWGIGIRVGDWGLEWASGFWIGDLDWVFEIGIGDSDLGIWDLGLGIEIGDLVWRIED